MEFSGANRAPATGATSLITSHANSLSPEIDQSTIPVKTRPEATSTPKAQFKYSRASKSLPLDSDSSDEDGGVPLPASPEVHDTMVDNTKISSPAEVNNTMMDNTKTSSPTKANNTMVDNTEASSPKEVNNTMATMVDNTAASSPKEVNNTMATMADDTAASSPMEAKVKAIAPNEEADESTEQEVSTVTAGVTAVTTTESEAEQTKPSLLDQFLSLAQPSKDSVGPIASYEMYEVRTSPGKGFGCFATKAIPQGTRILAETPLLSMEDREQLEYEFSKVSSVKRMEYVALYSHRGELFYKKFEHYVEDVGPEAQESTDKGREMRAECAWLANIWSIFETNAWDAYGLQYVCLDSSRFNNSCVPNAYAGWNNRIKQHTIHAIKNIAKGEEILVNYHIGEGVSREKRKAKHAFYGFQCDCPACDPETEFGKKSNIRRNLFATYEQQLRNISQKIIEEGGNQDAIDLNEKMIKLLEAEGLTSMKLAHLYEGVARIAGKAKAKEGKMNTLAASYGKKALKLLRICTGIEHEDYEAFNKEIEIGVIMGWQWSKDVFASEKEELRILESRQKKKKPTAEKKAAEENQESKATSQEIAEAGEILLPPSP